MRGDEPLLWFEEVYSASRQLLVSIYGVEVQSAFTKKLLYVFDGMSRQNPEIDLLPFLVAWPTLNNVLSIAPLIIAWQLLRFSAKLFDDAEDENDKRAELINLGTGFLFTAQQVLLQLKNDEIDKLSVMKIHQMYNLAALKACSGQYNDLVVQSKKTWIDPQAWLAIALAKSGELFGWATWAGACFAGFDDQTSVHYREFGYHLGGLLQIADDYNDAWGSKKTKGVAFYQNSLPYIYSHFVANIKQQSELERAVQEVIAKDLGAQKELENLLVMLGAQKYILAAGWLQKQKAIHALQKVEGTPDSQKHLLHLLDILFPSLP
jgi:geranylgeranyl pyrophosphate synthase